MLAGLLTLGVGGLGGAVEDDGSALHQTTSLIGPAVSGLFLVLIGLVNLVVAVWRFGRIEERWTAERQDG